jgi:catechol 2,3-dioxygenase-like lactoylglutathione lyase family enzyme
MIARRWCSCALLVGTVSILASAAAQSPAPAKPAPPQVRMGTKPQQFIMTKVTVSDLPKSFEFYTKVVGLKLVTSPDVPTAKAPTPSDPEKEFVEVPLNFSGSMADPLFVLMKQRGKKPVAEQASLVVIGFKVPDVRVAVKQAMDAGYSAPRGIPAVGMPGFINDPDGYKVEFIQVSSFAQE